MFTVSYVIIFVCHHHLNIKRVVIERNFCHSMKKLTLLDYLPLEQITFIKKSTLLKLKDYAIAVGQLKKKKKKKIAISTLFSTEFKFASDVLLKWFGAKHKTACLELSNEIKAQYKIANPTDWQAIDVSFVIFHLK